MKFRVLSEEEAQAVPGMQSPQASSLFVVGATDDKGLACACGVFLVAHADPLWVRPDLRNGGKLLLHLWDATKEEIRARNLADEVLVAMTADNPGSPFEEVVAKACVFAGGEEVKGRFFVVPTKGE